AGMPASVPVNDFVSDIEMSGFSTFMDQFAPVQHRDPVGIGLLAHPCDIGQPVHRHGRGTADVVLLAPQARCGPAPRETFSTSCRMLLHAQRSSGKLRNEPS